MSGYLDSEECIQCLYYIIPVREEVLAFSNQDLPSQFHPLPILDLPQELVKRGTKTSHYSQETKLILQGVPRKSTLYRNQLF
jgi:hypothetical protein